MCGRLRISIGGPCLQLDVTLPLFRETYIADEQFVSHAAVPFCRQNVDVMLQVHLPRAPACGIAHDMDGSWQLSMPGPLDSDSWQCTGRDG